VVPIAAGGATDTAARVIAEKLQQKLQQAVVVENRPGAGSIIGTNFVAKAAPDGHTLLLMEPGAVLAKWLNKTVPFDVTSNFSPIAMFAISPLVLFAHPSVPFKNVEELIAYVSQDETLHPGEFFGSGTGTVPESGADRCCCGLEMGRYLKAGDTVELEVEGIGKLTAHLIIGKSGLTYC